MECQIFNWLGVHENESMSQIAMCLSSLPENTLFIQHHLEFTTKHVTNVCNKDDNLKEQTAEDRTEDSTWVNTTFKNLIVLYSTENDRSIFENAISNHNISLSIT